jgi:hypothetical protein
VTGLFKKISAFLKRTDRKRKRRVRIAGKSVMMTAPQARRYRELRRAKTSAS